MSEFDSGFDLGCEIIDTAKIVLEKAIQLKGNEYNFPGWVQALYIFEDYILNCPVYICDEDLEKILIKLSKISKKNKYKCGFDNHTDKWIKDTTLKLDKWLKENQI